jgi:hypothetical protein
VPALLGLARDLGLQVWRAGGMRDPVAGRAAPLPPPCLAPPRARARPHPSPPTPHPPPYPLQVVGVSFHVGSGCQNVAVYADAIAAARAAFDLAPAYGFAGMHLLDVGGGFTAPHDADSAALFYRTAAVING